MFLKLLLKRTMLKKILWLLLILINLTVFINGIPIRIFDLQEAAKVMTRELNQLGLSENFFIVYFMLIDILAFGFFLLVGLSIFYYRPNKSKLWLISLSIVLWGSVYGPVISNLFIHNPFWTYFIIGLRALSLFCTLTFLFTFPDGRFIPGWTLLLTVGYAVVLTYWAFNPDTLFNILYLNEWYSPPLVSSLFFFCLHGIGIAVQGYRFKFVANNIERQQTKWVTFGLGIASLAVWLYFSILVLFFNQRGLLQLIYTFTATPFLLGALLTIPLTIAIAVIRYRLWEIDIIIRRTLIYSAVIGMLAIIYFGLVTFLQGGLRQILRQESDLAIVIATVISVWWFQPLRRWVQTIADRRFYRVPYDAVATMNQFSMVVQQEKNVDQLVQTMVKLIQQALQLNHVGVWLHPIVLPQSSIWSHRYVQLVVPESPLTWYPFAADDPLTAYYPQATGLIALNELPATSPTVIAMQQAQAVWILPLLAQGEVVGWVSLGARRSDQAYSGTDYELLRQLTIQAAPAIKAAQIRQQQQLEQQAVVQWQQELQVARQIQRSLLPSQVPALPGWEIIAHYRPAYAVGGDFYDFVTLPDGRLGLFIGDVTDKSIPAALLMATTRSSLRAAARRGASPGQVLAEANDLICSDIPEEMFVACFYAILDWQTGVMTYANAGHPVPYHVHQRMVKDLIVTGLPLGLFTQQTYEEQTVPLERGDRLLFYSDGLVETRNSEGEMWGKQPLEALLHEPGSLEQWGERILMGVEQFSDNNAGRDDDITLLLLTRNEDVPEVEERIRTYQLPNQEDHDRRFTTHLSEVVIPLGITDRRLERLQTAVSEAIMNAREHGHGFHSEEPIQVEVWQSSKTVTIRIINQGHGPEEPLTVFPDLKAKIANEERERGWGRFLMQSCVDEVRCYNRDEQYIVELRVRRSK